MPEFQLELMEDYCADDLRLYSKEYEKNNPLTERELEELKLFTKNCLNKAKKAASIGLYCSRFEILKRSVFANTFIEYIKNHGYKVVVNKVQNSGYNNSTYPYQFDIEISWD